MRKKLAIWTSSLALLFLLSAFGVGSAIAQSYPDKQIRFIVPYPPGGVVDLMARLIGQQLTQNLGQPVVVDNLPGASGIIGTDAAARAAPDGYAILMGYFSTLAIHPSIYSKLPYDPLRDFAPISLVAKTSLIAVVSPTLQINTLQAFVALAKSKPGQLNYASIGNGSGSHLAAELLKSTAGINLVQIPYKGSGPALNDVMGNRVHVMFDALPSSIPLVHAGRLRALAVTGSTRSPAAPEVPTVEEAGFPGYDIAPWLGVLAPAGTPKTVIARLHREIAKTMALPDVKAQLATLGADAAVDTPEQFTAYIKAELGKWGKLIKAANIRAEG